MCNLMEIVCTLFFQINVLYELSVRVYVCERYSCVFCSPFIRSIVYNSIFELIFQYFHLERLTPFKYSI